MINLQLPSLVQIDTPLGKFSFAPDEDAKLVFAYAKQMGDAINSRVADPTNKSVVIPIPTSFPTSYEQATPFGQMTFQYKASTIITLQLLVQIAQGINQDWNG